MQNKNNPKWIQRLPNQLTWLRVATIPVVVYFLVQIEPQEYGQTVIPQFADFMAASLFGFAALTDFFDGYIARRFGVETILGKLLDPLADKLLHVSAMIILVEKHRLAGWIACILIVRDLAINAIRMSAMEEGIVVPSNRLAKWKSGFIDVALIGLMIQGTILKFISAAFVGHVCIWLALFASVGSGFIYLSEYAKRLKKN